MILRIVVFWVLVLLVGCSGGDGPNASASPSPGSVAVGDQNLEGPAKVYMEFQSTLKNARSLSEILPYLADEQVKEVKQMGEPDALLPALKSLTPENLKLVGQDVKADKASLQLTGDIDGSPSTGTATLVMEGGKWKIMAEAWSDAPEPSPSPSAAGDY